MTERAPSPVLSFTTHRKTCLSLRRIKGNGKGNIDANKLLSKVDTSEVEKRNKRKSGEVPSSQLLKKNVKNDRNENQNESNISKAKNNIKPKDDTNNLKKPINFRVSGLRKSVSKPSKINISTQNSQTETKHSVSEALEEYFNDDFLISDINLTQDLFSNQSTIDKSNEVKSTEKNVGSNKLKYENSPVLFSDETDPYDDLLLSSILTQKNTVGVGTGSKILEHTNVDNSKARKSNIQLDSKKVNANKPLVEPRREVIDNIKNLSQKYGLNLNQDLQLIEDKSRIKISNSVKNSLEVELIAKNNVPEIEELWEETSANCREEIELIFNNLENSILDIKSDDAIVRFDPSYRIDKPSNSDESFHIVDRIRKQLLNNANKTIDVDYDTEVSFVKDDGLSIEVEEAFYGLPAKVGRLVLKHKGIEKLYEWQDECLNLQAVHDRKNLVYALPTSGGKTLVAEILMLRELICNKKDVLFILPFVSIVQEKVASLTPFALTLDFLVTDYSGNRGIIPPVKRRHKRAVYVATMEKALTIINSLLEDGRLGEIGLVVVDELHLIGEDRRGVVLETALTKILNSKESIHVVGMSATIGNLTEVCAFLNAYEYTCDFRPVELTEMVKCQDHIATVDYKASDPEKLFVPLKEDKSHNPSLDADNLGGLVLEVIPDNSCLLFCPTKANCENVAKLLCMLFRKNNKELMEHRKNDKETLVAQLKHDGSICPILKNTIAFGVAYHHSGLTHDERVHIEDAFRNGVLCVICCTSTLAAGVNLPAKRVILRHPYVGKQFITKSKYKQMVGRAGRTGLGETGESIVICEHRDIDSLRKMLMAPMDDAVSGMLQNESVGLKNLILSSVSFGEATTRKQITQLATNTLLGVQAKKLEITVEVATDTAIKELFQTNALQMKSSASENPSATSVVESNKSNHLNLEGLKSDSTKEKNVFIENDAELAICKLGKAAIKGGFDLEKAHILYEDLQQAQASLNLCKHLHLLYLVTPYDDSHHVKPTLNIYYYKYDKLEEDELITARLIGITEACAVKMLNGRPIRTTPERAFSRFYSTLILYELWKQKPLFAVAEEFKVNRGTIQQLMTSAASFASGVVRFCQELEEFWPYRELMGHISLRLTHCCTPELLPLMDLPSVRKSRAKQLYSAGYPTLELIAKAKPYDLVAKIEYLNVKAANQLISAAKLILLEKVEYLREEAEDVLDHLN